MQLLPVTLKETSFLLSYKPFSFESTYFRIRMTLEEKNLINPTASLLGNMYNGSSPSSNSWIRNTDESENRRAG
jgi:hypothetical protein